MDNGEQDDWCLSVFFEIDIKSIVGSGGNKRHKDSAQRGSISY